MKTNYYVISNNYLTLIHKIGEFESLQDAIKFCEKNLDNYELLDEREFIEFTNECNKLIQSNN